MTMELAILIDKDGDLPTYRQIYEQLRGAISDGRLPPGQRIPSVRRLARSLKISCNTVSQSYELLHSEGYLQSRIGSGTFVNQQLPEDLLKLAPAQSSITSSCNNSLAIRLSQYGTTLKELKPKQGSHPSLTLSCQYRPSQLDPTTLHQWKKLWTSHCQTEKWTHLQNASEPLGLPSLREAIARYIARSRAVRCEPEQVIIFNSTLQAIELITRVLVEQGDRVVLENPGCLGVHQIFLAQGAQLHPVAVDDSGIVVEQLPFLSDTKTKLIYVTPSHQFPLGGVLSLHRRLELLEWANRSGAMIIEDDYDSEYRYCGRPIPALQGLDRNDSVIYLGDFSGSLFPTISISYLVTPPALLPILSYAKELTNSRSSIVEQHVLADFINEGYLERHIRRTWKQYSQRRHFLIDQLQHHLDNRVAILGEDAGMHITVRLHDRFDDKEIREVPTLDGKGWVSTHPYYLQNPRYGEFVLGYTDLNYQEIRSLVQSLSAD